MGWNRSGRSAAVVALTGVILVVAGCAGCAGCAESPETRENRPPSSAEETFNCRAAPREIIGECRGEAGVRFLLAPDEKAASALRQQMGDDTLGRLYPWVGPQHKEVLVVGDIVAVPTVDEFELDRADEDASDEPVDGMAVVGATATRPAPIGESTGRPLGLSGSLGCRVRRDDQVFVLSNYHVFALDPNVRKHDRLIQPSRRYSGTLADHAFAHLWDWECLDFGSPNRFDAAIARTTRRCMGSSTANREAYGRPREKPYDATYGLNVMKVGRTTGFRRGRVRCTEAQVCVRYGGRYARFVDQIIVDQPPGLPRRERPFCRRGDSGALVVVGDRHPVEGDRRRPVGLHTASGNLKEEGVGKIKHACIVSPIAPILSRFGLVVDGQDDEAGDCDLEELTLQDGPDCELDLSLSNVADRYRSEQ